jgi:hypothetical protein
MDLLEHDFLPRPVQRAPLLDAALHRAKLAITKRLAVCRQNGYRPAVLIVVGLQK